MAGSSYQRGKQVHIHSSLSYTNPQEKTQVYTTAVCGALVNAYLGVNTSAHFFVNQQRYKN